MRKQQKQMSALSQVQNTDQVISKYNLGVFFVYNEFIKWRRSRRKIINNTKMCMTSVSVSTMDFAYKNSSSQMIMC